MHVGEEQGIAEYEEETRGLKIKGVVGVFLQWTQESSLPVSSTMTTCCGGDPIERETVSETLWWKATLFGGFEAEIDGVFLAMRGRINECLVAIDWMNKTENTRWRRRTFTESSITEQR